MCQIYIEILQSKILPFDVKRPSINHYHVNAGQIGLKQCIVTRLHEWLDENFSKFIEGLQPIALAHISCLWQGTALHQFKPLDNKNRHGAALGVFPDAEGSRNAKTGNAMMA